MTDLPLPVPGPFFGPYPERESERAPAWKNATRLTPSLFSRRAQKRFLDRIRGLRADAGHLALISTLVRQEEVLKRLQSQGFTPELAAEVLLRVGSACHLELGMNPAEEQYLAAWVILQGGLAELAGGEGKSLAIAMAACAAAVTGIPVHVFTANDYLAERDAAALGPLFEHFGLTVACVTKLHSFEQRRRAYHADITYCTAREVGFDYLRDLASPNMAEAGARGRTASDSDRALRGLCMAIVDDADATLLDEARSPMTISRPAPSGASLNALEQAMLCARRLEPDKHYRLDTAIQNVQLTPAGKARLAESQNDSAAHWRNPRQREELVDLALYAIHLLVRERDYVQQDGSVALIDPTTGEPDSGRDWNRGLVQMLALKEGVSPPPINETVAQMSLQSLFGRYHWLGGVSASLAPAKLELAVLYDLRITRIGGRILNRRRRLPTRVFSQRFLVWRAVAQRVRELQETGRPVLIGTDSVADAEALAAVLSKNGLRWQLLQGRQDSIEHSAIARAGRPLRITIVAQAAGRGTSIEVEEGVAENGGLHVISCAFSGVRRAHHQLLARAARRGQPGSGEVMLCLDQGLLAQHLPQPLRHAARRLISRSGEVPSFLAPCLDAIVQRIEELSHRWTLWKLRREDRSWRRRMEVSKPST
jgi:preprotein translocase subunit SecA